MNNNYHTQLDKQPNMLNEIAANNHLLQQQMQNFPGTPINKSISNNLPLMNQQLPVQPQMNQTFDPQQMQQLMHQYVSQNQPQNNSTQINNGNPVNNEEEELELSETKQESKKTVEKKILSDSKTSNLKSQRDIRPEPENTQSQINKQIQKLSQTKDTSGDLMIPHSNKTQSLPKTYIACPPVSHENKTFNYVIMPLLLIIFFVILVHPKTSSLLEKYVPKMNDLKGIFVRGIILAIAYLVIKIVSGVVTK